jgi:hypothetical protein
MVSFRVEWLDGTLRWTLFERPGELVCATHGGTAPARAAGGSPPHCSSRTHDVRYSWLNGRLAVWEGEFDAKEERARYHAYLAPELRVR